MLWFLKKLITLNLQVKLDLMQLVASEMKLRIKTY